MIRRFRLTITAATLLAAIAALHGCSRNITAASVAGTCIRILDGQKLTLNPDATGKNVQTSSERFLVKYRVEDNKIVMQEHFL